jgi:hypothetical protein
MAMPTLSEMFYRLVKPEGQTRIARTIEIFGWFDLVVGLVILVAPGLVELVLSVPPLTVQGANYLRLAGLLVAGLGTLYVVSGRLESPEFAFASLIDRPFVPVIMAILWWRGIIPGSLALAFSVADFGGFLWTLSAWRAATRGTRAAACPPFGAKTTAGIFGFLSGVVRNSRIFHPDGRTFRASVRSLRPANPSLARAAAQLEGSTALLRIGMGLMKRGWPRWLADVVPDAPSIAARFYTEVSPGETRVERRPGEDLDLLCTAGGDRLWKLLVNLAAGGRMFGLRKFDYFQNLYFTQVPYRVDDGHLDVWIRFVPDLGTSETGSGLRDGVAREERLTRAVAHHATVRIEAQPVAPDRAPFLPIAEMRFEEEIQIDQESLHFDPVAGRGFAPYGYLTELRRTVYPASVQSRPPIARERTKRESEGLVKRLARFFRERPSPILDGGSLAVTAPATDVSSSPRWRRWLRAATLVVLTLVVAAGVYLAGRLTSDHPVEYADDVEHFKHGSTGGERMSGFPYWIWVALPEVFPEHLPDKTPGRGYTSFGLIYEPGSDPRYDLPVGVSRRRVQGIERVFLNCAVCHTGTVRDAPGAAPRVIVGMPANTFDLGALTQFLMDISLSEKFSAPLLLAQIRKMERMPHRQVVRPDDFLNRLLIRSLAVSLMRDRLLMIRERLLFTDPRSAGPGRVDTFNNAKALLNFPMRLADPTELRGNSDFPSIWNQGPRKGMQLHWDGNNVLVDERNLSAAFGTGAFPPTLDAERVLRIAKYLETAQPPPYPYPIDQARAAEGANLYSRYCAGCHGTREPPFRQNPPRADERVGTVVPIARIGTDRRRLDSYTWFLAVSQNTLYAGYEKDWGFTPAYPQRFSHFRKTFGYANAPLDGIWLRAPYLHNGSVPNLRELFEPAGARTKVFYRGGDVYDPVNVGFIGTLPTQEGRALFRFDTGQPGNGNGGHEGQPYATDLPAEQKRALLEYLKTF